MTNPQASTTLLHPADVFTHLIITYLTPMFLATTGGDIQYARMAATEAVNAYAAHEPIDLLSIAQVIAFGLAILDSLNRSMAENLPAALVLRLRSNAVSLGRIAEHCHRALAAAPSSDAADRRIPEFDPKAERQREEAALAGLARGEQCLAEVTASARPTHRTTARVQTSHLAPKAATLIQQMQAIRDSGGRALQSASATSRAGIPP
jgi:hypothetical protein